MSKETVVVRSGGSGVAGLLGVVFVTLKLCGVITWPWLWVLSPFWVPLAIIVGVVVIAGFFALMVMMFTTYTANKAMKGMINEEYPRDRPVPTI